MIVNGRRAGGPFVQLPTRMASVRCLAGLVDYVLIGEREEQGWACRTKCGPGFRRLSMG